jgi:DNA-directed RNA polymerase III subunit RPC1
MLNVLKCVCKKCGSVLLPLAEKANLIPKMRALKFNYSARAMQMKKILKECAKQKFCEVCGYTNPVVQKVPKLAGRIDAKQLSR